MSKYRLPRFTPAIVRFYAFTVKGETPDDCWLWNGTMKKRGGYGLFDMYGHGMHASRASYILHNGPIPEQEDALHVCHRCDNPRCVNPKHLFLGTHRQNVNDATTKGRMGRKAKILTAERMEYIVVSMRAGRSMRSLAREIGCNHASISERLKKTVTTIALPPRA